MKKIVIIEENGILGAGESSECLVITAGVANGGRNINPGEKLYFSFPFELNSPKSSFDFPGTDGDLLKGCVPLVTLTKEMLLSDVELLGSHIENGTILIRLKFNSGIHLNSNTSLVNVRFATGIIQFKSVGKQKPAKRIKK